MIQLEKLIDIVYNYCNKWRLKVVKYTYLGIDIACNGAWDVDI